MKENKKSLFTITISILIFILSIDFANKPTQAFIPLIYQPTLEEFNSTSINIGNTAIQLIQMGQIKEALDLLKLAVQLNPKEERLWILLADAQLKTKDTSRAIESLNKATKLNPNQDDIWFSLASLYIKENEADKALIALKKALQINKKNATGYFLLGNANLMLEKTEMALKAFQKASKLKPDF